MSKPVINVTPLIDVLLVLLIIFMVVSPLKPASMKARLPAEPKKVEIPPHVHPLTLVLAVNNDLSLKINQENPAGTVDAPQPMIDRLREIFRLRAENGETERTVFVKAQKNLDYGHVVKVVDAAKMAGADPISLQIDFLEPATAN